jgi:predicted  nucleic acid-binding Zn-ribbon protein
VKLLQAREEEIASLQTQLETQTTESEREIQALQTRITEKQAELDKITNTLGWRLLSRYGRIRHRFLIPAYRFLRPNASDGKR